MFYICSFTVYRLCSEFCYFSIKVLDNFLCVSISNIKTYFNILNSKEINDLGLIVVEQCMINHKLLADANLTVHGSVHQGFESVGITSLSVSVSEIKLLFLF
jgi:hypothetical protein